MNTKLSLAISAAILQGAAMTASAYTPATPADSDYNIYFGGATASNLTLRQTIIEQMCDENNVGGIDVFVHGSDADPTKSPLHWTVACHTTSAKIPGLATSPARVIFHKTNDGGSGTGVNPVQQKTKLNFLITSTTANYVDSDGETNAAANCDATGVNQVTPAPTSRAYRMHTCAQNQVEKRIPDGGTSDLEPNKFFGINTPAGSSDFNSTLTNMDVYSVAHLVFGVAITKDLRDGMQRVVFPSSSVCHPAHASYAANAESEACMVNLTSSEIRSMLGGTIKDWDQVRIVPAGSSTPTTLRAAVTAAGGAALVPTDKLLGICRRVKGSGTQAQANAILTGWPCDTDKDGIAVREPTEAQDLDFGPVTVLNSGSGDVSKCLDDYNDGSTAMSKPKKPEADPAIDPDDDYPDATKRWAIGINSLENNMNLSLSYRFVKIDGYAPTLKNVHSGNYQDWAAQSVQWRNDGTFVYPSFASDIVKVFTFLKDSWITQASIVNLNGTYIHSFGQSGWLIEPKNGSGVPDNDFVATKPINAYTRSPGSQAPNTCQAPVKFIGTTTTSITIGD